MKASKRKPPRVVLDEETRLAREKWAHLRAVDRHTLQPVGAQAWTKRARKLAKRLGTFGPRR